MGNSQIPAPKPIVTPKPWARSVATLRRVLDAEGISHPLLGGRQHFPR